MLLVLGFLAVLVCLGAFSRVFLAFIFSGVVSS